MTAIYRKLHLLFLLSAFGSGCAEPPAAAPAPSNNPEVSTEISEESQEAPGRGFVVWESNRSGAWRLWRRDLDGSPARQLSPDEGDRQHCCPHIAPGGERIAYLSLPRGQANYPDSGASGPMHLIDADGGNDRVIAPIARTYFEHRAAVWRDARELTFIDGEGRTLLLDTESGESRVLIERGEPRHGWLLNGALSHGTTGHPSFSAYDAPGRKIEPARLLGGCQPYFSHDGRWGFWVAGAGGPIRALDLRSRQTIELLAKSDPRLPSGQGYLYFPMLSHDSTLIAVAASPNQHEHATSNYDVFVAALDPETLEVLGKAWRVTSDTGVDRFPDVYAEPLPLGRQFGEAPFSAEWTAPEPGDWQWLVDGDEIAAGERFEHRFEHAGSFRIEARRETASFGGLVRVRAAKPPQVVDSAVRDGRQIVVRFDEAIDTAEATATFASDLGVERLEAGDDGRSLVVTSAAELDDFETLRLEGVRDLAQLANVMAAAELEIEPPWWPATRRGLVFLWDSDDATNEIERDGAPPRACVLSPRGRAWLDRNFAMRLRGGTFVTDADSVRAVLEACQQTNELTLEATLTPDRSTTPDLARIFSFSGNLQSRNFTLGQDGDRLVFRLRTGTTGRNADQPQLELGRVVAGRPTHVMVSYTVGRLIAWLDGEKVLETDAIRKGFFHWRPLPLIFGNEWKAERPWHGSLEAVAIYNRALSEDEARESYRRASRRLAARTEIPTLRLRGTLVSRSRAPSLEEIAPYREALAVFEYRIEEILEGDYADPLIRVAHRVLNDGEALPIARRAEGQSFELMAESFFDQPQLESLYLANTLPDRPDAPLYFGPAIE